MSFRATARNLTPQPMETIKISPDGRNDIMAICTFYETIKHYQHAASAGGRRPIHHGTAEAVSSEITVRPSLYA
ncbi:MAG: hypothetical protein ABIJ50_08540 [Pseudomonadota bacterium]